MGPGCIGLQNAASFFQGNSSCFIKIHWMLTAEWQNALITIWAALLILLIMQAIIETKGLSKSVQLSVV